MRKKFSTMVASVLLLALPMQVFASDVLYPLKSLYPDGVEPAEISLFSNSKVEKPINTGFEKNNEIELLINGSESSQVGVSEDSYSGKFALKIRKTDDEIISVYDTEYFQTGYGPSDTTQQANIQPTNLDGTNNAKCNFYTLKLKPMSNSETISFYVKVKKLNELGNIEENYVLIKSDEDRDGVYSVGTDLSRGKWQTVQLNIADLDEEFQNGAASGLYMKANQGSQWLIDDISSGYRKTNEAKFNLNEFASENVIYSQDVLRFGSNNNDSEGYNIGSRVVSSGIKVSEQLSGIQIDSSFQYASSDNVQQGEIKEILYSASFENENCVVNNEGEEIVCEKVQKPKEREELPTIPSSGNLKITLNSETEKRIRLLLTNKNSTSSSNSKQITIRTGSGETKTYYLSNSIIYTDWFESDITISSSYALTGFMEIKAIEYDSIEENFQQDILVNQGGSFSINLGEFITDDRTNLVYEVSYENSDTVASELLLEFFEGDSSEPYYATKTYMSSVKGKQIFNNIIPKIRANTKLKITNVITDRAPVIIRFSRLEISKLLDSDWNKNIDYVDYEITKKKFDYEGDSTHLERRPAKSIYTESEKYAVVYPDTEGLINIGTGNKTVGEIVSDIAVYRILNLSEEPVNALVVTSQGTGSKPIYLHYGMADYVVSESNKYLSLPPNEKVMFIGKISYSDQKGDTSPVHYNFVDGLYDGEFVENGTSIIYPNVYDKDSPYKYDLETKTSKKIADDKLICSSPDGTRLLLQRDNGTYYILNIATNEKEETPLTGSYIKCFFNIKNELFVVNDMLSYYSAGELHNLCSVTTTSVTYCSYDFDATGEYLLWTLNKTAKLFKNTNGIWNEIKNFSADAEIDKVVLCNDVSTAYIQTKSKVIYTVDLNTLTISKWLSGDIFDITDDNMLLFSENNYNYLYNPVTAERYKLFNSQFVCDSITYNNETNMVAGIMPNSRVVYHRFTAQEPEAKYALSFDGRKTWYSYTGGRWQTVSKSTVPTGDELRLAGMTASAVNSIPSSAYEKLYSNNTDVLTVDVAIYMYSDSQNRTPVIENIVVETVEKEASDATYGIHIEKYNKEDYRKITSLFPIENFGSNAECYYLLYIGNEWLYTYKDNELIKVNQPANILLSDMSESWIKFKQYGMTAKELRNVPSDVLSELFVNDDFANTEFGVIYVVKTKNEDTAQFVVNFHLGSSSDFITDTDVVVELTMSGGEVKVIDSAEFSTADIEDFLNWIEARQNGDGEIFYRLKNATTQHFINYYMINSISIYNGEEYRSRAQ